MSGIARTDHPDDTAHRLLGMVIDADDAESHDLLVDAILAIRLYLGHDDDDNDGDEP